MRGTSQPKPQVSRRTSAIGTVCAAARAKRMACVEPVLMRCTAQPKQQVVRRTSAIGTVRAAAVARRMACVEPVLMRCTAKPKQQVARHARAIGTVRVAAVARRMACVEPVLNARGSNATAARSVSHKSDRSRVHCRSSQAEGVRRDASRPAPCTLQL